MVKAKNGTNVYKAVCAVIFILFSFVYLYCYQTDILAAAQHVASGGRTQYEPVLGTTLLIIALKLLQNGIQAAARLQRIFYALTYLPSFLLLAFITDIPSKSITEITFGAWAWAMPLTLIVWAFIIYMARQYQPVEVEAREGGFLSQVMGVNLTLVLAMMLITCLIGNHNRTFHQQMRVENLISRSEYKEAQIAAESFHSNNNTLSILRAYSLAQQRKSGDELFKVPMNGIKSIKPYNSGTYTVIVPFNNLVEFYKRNADWQLCEMLVQKNLNDFYDNLVFFYNLDNSSAANDSSAVSTKNTKAIAKQNAYKDSIMSIRYHNLPLHYQEALILYNELNATNNSRPKIKINYLNKDLLDKFIAFQKANATEKRKKFANTYWMFFIS